MKIIKLRWTGIRPFIMHNGLLADPTNPYTVQIKKITSKGAKKLTLRDYEDRDRLEWEGGLYWSEKDGPIIPSDNIERCVQLGAQKNRKGKDVQAAVFCSEPEYPVEYKGPRDKDAMYESGAFQIRKGVCVQRSRIIRLRPMFPTGWSVTFDLEYDESVINEATVLDACNDAGTYVGLGDHRPKFGRFLCEKVK